MSISSGLLCDRPEIETFTCVIIPLIPLTVMLDGYGFAFPLDGIEIALVLLNVVCAFVMKEESIRNVPNAIILNPFSGMQESRIWMS